MEFLILFFIQLAVLLFFMWAERRWPHQTRRKHRGFNRTWATVLAFAWLWAQVLLYGWSAWATDQPILANHWVPEGFTYYLIYSCVNYWAHRLKHAWQPAWKYLHYMHHSPSHMESRVAFYRHPVELIANSLVLILTGKLLFNVSPEAIALALTIEGSLETFHHSNIRLQKRIRPLGYLIQTPEQHLLHHQRGLHARNYSPITLWDTIFGTVAFPAQSVQDLGFKDKGRAWPYLWFKQ